MSQQSDPRIDKAQERVNRAQEMESRYDMVLRSYQALGRVTPETLVNYNAYLKEYHVLMLEIMNGLKEQTNEVRRIQDETSFQSTARPSSGMTALANPLRRPNPYSLAQRYRVSKPTFSARCAKK